MPGTSPNPGQPRRRPFVIIAEAYLRQHAPNKTITTNDFWRGLSAEHPELCSITPNRKTPRQSCLRDLRSDPAFQVGDRKIALAKSNDATA